MNCCNYHLPPRKKLTLLPLLITLGVLGTLGACTTSNINDGLRPSATVGNANVQTQPNIDQPPANAIALAPANDQAIQPPLEDALAPTPGVAFLPVLGPPQSAVTKLSSALKNSARGHNVTIVPNGQRGAKYQVKGYFSALDDGAGTRLIYYWDILDANGRNIHRITGEERTNSRNANPWSAVTPAMIDIVVERTMQNLRGWISTRA